MVVNLTHGAALGAAQKESGALMESDCPAALVTTASLQMSIEMIRVRERAPLATSALLEVCHPLLLLVAGTLQRILAGRILATTIALKEPQSHLKFLKTTFRPEGE
jgi:hypothetical protein